ncbi:transcriptional regulator [Flaviflexus equikiangi]|uniref:Transcriptional regulator n=1 Tax=Flaviflexus equikiangi TaxID=2758573 RepID=A0ABS2THI8_9ACTO|nr:transcriptional regulator [Flaviflexus equikiangi]MBM9434119.1 transcriptional regulator [Flaviflexus equikiangi]
MRANLDPIIHAPKRLMAMAILANTEHASFQFLKDQLGLTDSDLSKQMAALESAGYVTITKKGRGPGSVTTFAMTKTGSRAYTAHREALHALLGSHPAGTSSG